MAYHWWWVVRACVARRHSRFSPLSVAQAWLGLLDDNNKFQKQSAEMRLLRYSLELDSAEAGDQTGLRARGEPAAADLYAASTASPLSRDMSAYGRAGVRGDRSGRLLVECKRLTIGTSFTPAEPFFCTLALYNVISRQKVSEDFHFHLNTPITLGLVAKHHAGVEDATRAVQALFKVSSSPMPLAD